MKSVGFTDSKKLQIGFAITSWLRVEKGLVIALDADPLFYAPIFVYPLQLAKPTASAREPCIPATV